MTTKKTIKVRDLKPSKDAKGGGGPSANRGHSVNKGGAVNTTKTQGHGHSHN